MAPNHPFHEFDFAELTFEHVHQCARSVSETLKTHWTDFVQDTSETDTKPRHFGPNVESEYVIRGPRKSANQR
jgi:hypothetical protein